jgi:DNA-binding XRE family transcriptional regulator
MQRAIDVEKSERAFGRVSRSAIAFYRVRRELGVNQSTMAKLLGVSSVSVSNAENGVVKPKDATAKKLRDLAFANRLPFAHEIFPEIDLGDRCPHCGK